MRGTHWSQGYNRPTGCSAEKPPHATFKFNFNTFIPTVCPYKLAGVRPSLLRTSQPDFVAEIIMSRTTAWITLQCQGSVQFVGRCSGDTHSGADSSVLHANRSQRRYSSVLLTGSLLHLWKRLPGSVTSQGEKYGQVKCRYFIMQAVDISIPKTRHRQWSVYFVSYLCVFV